MKMNLPALLEFGDYHEIGDFRFNLQQIFPEVKVKEVTDKELGIYLAFVYRGKLTDPKNKKYLEGK